MLLVDSEEPIYIPVTQDPIPKTEDALEEGKFCGFRSFPFFYLDFYFDFYLIFILFF